MQKFSTWMVMSLAIMFWILRIIVTYCYAMQNEFIATPLNFETEVAVLFIALLSFILLAKRKWLGAIIYAVSYELYFGADLINSIAHIESLGLNEYTNMLFSFFGMLLPLFALFDLAMDKNRKAHPSDKKTDFFYKNEKFDRNMDERADKNNYRTL